MTFELWERNDLKGDNILLSQGKRPIDQFNLAGKDLDVSIEDFRRDESSGLMYIPLELSPGLARVDERLAARLDQGIGETFRRVGKDYEGDLLFDSTAAIGDGLARAFLDYVILEGNVTKVSFLGKGLGNGQGEDMGVNSHLLYLSLVEEGRLTNDGESFVQQGRVIPLGYIDHIMGHPNSFEGELDVSHIGRFNLHGKSLRPYHSQTNPRGIRSKWPGAVLLDDTSTE
ncbi:hypothetical protein HOF78_04065 [Candidatus Woesearchaeota archaeon]|jgi:hypothetical protein|nr:hypothetical protein [Candidatus Woesearchaeota archaeon]MBT6044463.1 hypothetical protein [Candidatus Woesearchaeota archaeon]